jgi:hypothetical protein
MGCRPDNGTLLRDYRPRHQAQPNRSGIAVAPNLT